MAAVSPVREWQRLLLSLPVHPWLHDHHFNGRSILPAVEAMGLLARSVHTHYPHCDVHHMAQANFSKFLEINRDQETIAVVVEMAETENSDICARLLSRKQLKAMTRMTLHCQLHFAGKQRPAPAPTSPESWPSPSGGQAVEASRIYQDLVPFGPSYRTLQGSVVLEDDSAYGVVQAPSLAIVDSPLGSAFPLDAAMHAACVHGQRIADFIPFPVEFASRVIHRPTRSGARYQILACLRSQTTDELVYDLRISDLEGRIRETVLGLRMRDVSGGRIRPPEWIKKLSA